MEYEIEDETLLFDESTNPSLKHTHPQAARKDPSARPQDYPPDKRKRQKAVLIPDEEEQLA